MKRISVIAFAALAFSATSLGAQGTVAGFPEGDVAAYIDKVDAAMLPVNCKARMAIVDSYSTGETEAARASSSVRTTASCGSRRPRARRKTSRSCATRTPLRALRDDEQGRQDVGHRERPRRRDVQPRPDALQHEPRLLGELPRLRGFGREVLLPVRAARQEDRKLAYSLVRLGSTPRRRCRSRRPSTPCQA